MGLEVLSTRSTSEQVLPADWLDGKVWDEEKVLACLGAAADEPQIILDGSKKKRPFFPPTRQYF